MQVTLRRLAVVAIAVVMLAIAIVPLFTIQTKAQTFEATWTQPRGITLAATTSWSVQITDRRPTAFEVETTASAVDVYISDQGPWTVPAGRSLTLHNLSPFGQLLIVGTAPQTITVNTWKNR